MFVVEKVNPDAANFIQPSFSLTTVVANFFSPAAEITDTFPEIGAFVNPYRQRAVSLRRARL
jgi:hypothetical protein